MRAFIFPGQGSRSVGMGKALAEASKEEPRLLASFGPLRAGGPGPEAWAASGRR